MLYLVSSNSYHLIDDEIKKIYKDKNYDTLDFNKSDMNDLIEEFGYTDLFGTEKNLVVKNATFFEPKGEGDTKLLEKYLENPNPLTSIIFICSSVDERKKIFKLMKDNYHVNIIKPLYQKDICDRLLNYAKRNDFILSVDDAKYICEVSLNNYDLAINSLEKIFLYYDNKGCKIEHRDVLALSSMALEDNNFKFVDSVINHDYKTTLKILRDFKIEKVEPLTLFNLLAREYRLMYLLRNEYRVDSSKRHLMSKIGLADWQIDKILKEASSYTDSMLEDNLLTILDYDYKIKTGVIDKYLALEMFVLK